MPRGLFYPDHLTGLYFDQTLLGPLGTWGCGRIDDDRSVPSS
jgi:hypothetical protein